MSDRHSPGVYRASAHSWNESGLAYGGVHATLLRASNVGEVVDYMVDRGVMPVDAALRYGAGQRQRPARSVQLGTHKSRINVWAVRTPAVWVATQMKGWRESDGQK